MSKKTSVEAKQKKGKQNKLAVDKEDRWIEIDDDSEKATIDNVIDETLSLKLEESDHEKIADDDTESEIETTVRSDETMSPLGAAPLLARRGTYVLTSATLKDRKLVVADSDEDVPSVSDTSQNSEEVYFERLDKHLDPNSAAELLNEYYDELNDTVTNMKDLQGKYEKLNNLNKCNMNMMRREMTGWTDYYKTQIEQTSLLSTTREIELNETKEALQKTLAENKQLKNTNSKLELAIQIERQKLKNYIQQNIRDRVKQMTHSFPDDNRASKPNPSEQFLTNKSGASRSTPKTHRRVVQSVSPINSTHLKPDATNSGKKPSGSSQLPSNKKPKYFPVHQAWDNSTSTAEKPTTTKSVPKNKKAPAKRDAEHTRMKPGEKAPQQSSVKDAMNVKQNSEIIPAPKAKEFEDILHTSSISKKMMADEVRSLDESQKILSQKVVLGKKHPVRHTRQGNRQ